MRSVYQSYRRGLKLIYWSIPNARLIWAELNILKEETLKSNFVLAASLNNQSQRVTLSVFKSRGCLDAWFSSPTIYETIEFRSVTNKRRQDDDVKDVYAGECH